MDTISVRGLCCGIYTTFIAVMLLLPQFLSPVHAQNINIGGGQNFSFGVAYYVPLIDKTVRDGDIISSTKAGFTLSKTAYDQLMIGVVAKNPAVAFDASNSQRKVAILSTGNVKLNVTTANGPITKGDPVTSSSLAGVGMKALEPGYVIGVAMTDYTERDTKKVGQIDLQINIHYYSGKNTVKNKLFDVIRLTSIATQNEPLIVFRYLVAACILIFSFVFGFIFFGRVASMGVEALGRNPLAGRTIQFGIFLNVLITIAITVAGIIISIFILSIG